MTGVSGGGERGIGTEQPLVEVNEMLWLLVLLVVLVAIVGGVAISKFVFLLLVAAVILALLGAFSRSAA